MSQYVLYAQNSNRLEKHLVWWNRVVQTDFVTLLRNEYPHLLPSLFNPEAGSPLESPFSKTGGASPLPHGTTILALRYAEGVIIAGDRQATAGYEVADRNIQKVYMTDDYSAIAIAGIAGPAVQMAKLLSTQLEFYEKVEGTVLSLEGKANYVSHLLRQNLPAAIQGLVVIPIFAGYDLRRGEGRIYKYDITGGRYEETDYYATGSGGKDARSTLKKRFRPQLPRDEALRYAIEALMDASDEDIATGGIDFVRGIYPTVKLISREGIQDLPNSDIGAIATILMEELRQVHALTDSNSRPQLPE